MGEHPITSKVTSGRSTNGCDSALVPKHQKFRSTMQHAAGDVYVDELNNTV